MMGLPSPEDDPFLIDAARLHSRTDIGQEFSEEVQGTLDSAEGARPDVANLLVSGARNNLLQEVMARAKAKQLSLEHLERLISISKTIKGNQGIIEGTDK